MVMFRPSLAPTEMPGTKVMEDSGMEGRPLIVHCERMAQSFGVLFAPDAFTQPCIDLTGTFGMQFFSQNWYGRMKIALTLIRKRLPPSYLLFLCASCINKCSSSCQPLRQGVLPHHGSPATTLSRGDWEDRPTGCVFKMGK